MLCRAWMASSLPASLTASQHLRLGQGCDLPWPPQAAELDVRTGAGKSSLVNHLAGRNASRVSANESGTQVGPPPLLRSSLLSPASFTAWPPARAAKVHVHAAWQLGLREPEALAHVAQLVHAGD